MRYLFSVLLLTAAFPLLLKAQRLEVINITGAFACSYYGDSINESIHSFSSVTEAEDIIEDIIGVIGLKPRFEIRSADVPNAAAVIYRNKRFVLYNPGFIKQMNAAAGNKWASVSILAHEIGHHLNGHTLEETGSRPDVELEADEFSGFVLRKLGASLEEAQIAMKIAASVKASHTHPGRNDRLSAIARGWNHADEQIAGKTSPVKTNKQIEKPAVVVEPQKDESPLAEKYIAMDVSFYADPQGVYHVTIRDHLVKLASGNIYIIGMFAHSNKKGYPYMLYDKHYNYLYINSRGAIVNGAGRKVGLVKVHR
jgi:hypothetical protein